MGEKPLEEFLLYYERALRLTHQAAVASYDQARTYTSLTHSWTTPSGPTDPSGRFYPGRDVLDELNALTKRHGDYGWHLAHHPYPEDLRDPAFWNDETATDDIESTERVTFKNVELLPEYLQRDELSYDGEPRRIVLSEQGCNTPDESAEAEELQAACYALAYYKIHFADGIDSFILHRHVDHKLEDDLRLGLWTWDDDRDEPSSPGRPKHIYDVFTEIDTEASLEATEFAKPIIGITEWSEMVDDFDPDGLAVRPTPAAVQARTDTRPIRPTTLFDFEDGPQGWRPSDSATAVHADRRHLRVEFDELAKLWRGTDVLLADPVDASSTPHLGLRLRLPRDQGAAGERAVRVTAYAGEDRAVGTADLADGPQWQQVVMDLGDWEGRDRIDRLKVWVRGSTNADWAGFVGLDDVTLSGRTR